MTSPTQASPAPETAKTQAAEAPEPTVTAVGGAEVKMVDIPRTVYDTAIEDNRQRTFVHSILEARAPTEAPPYIPPPVPAGVAEQTRLEIEAGKKRVAEFEATETARRKVAELHKNDKWQTPNKVEAVFRPGDFVPDQRKGQGNVGGRAVNVS